MGNYVNYPMQIPDDPPRDFTAVRDALMDPARLFSIIQGVTAASQPRYQQPDTHQGGFKGYIKDALGKFMYSFGEGMAAGGGVQGMGVAINAPRKLEMYRQQQEEQRQQQEYENQLRSLDALTRAIQADSSLRRNEDQLVDVGTIPGFEQYSGVRIPHSSVGPLIGAREKPTRTSNLQRVPGIIHYASGDVESYGNYNPESGQMSDPLGRILAGPKLFTPGSESPEKPQLKTGMLNGKRSIAFFYPTQRKLLDPAGNDVTASFQPVESGDPEAAALRRQLLEAQLGRIREQADREGGLTAANARSLRGQIMTEARARKNDIGALLSGDPIANEPLDDVMRRVADEWGFDLESINATAAGQKSPKAASSQTPSGFPRTGGGASKVGEAKTYQGYEYRFNGKEWVRGQKVQ